MLQRQKVGVAILLFYCSEKVGGSVVGKKEEADEW